MNTPETNPPDGDDLRQELLDYLFGCHADAQALEARLAADPALQRMLDETRPLAALLTEASSDDAPSEPLQASAAPFAAPHADGAIHSPTHPPVRSPWQRPWLKVAAVFVGLAAVPALLWGMRAHELASISAEALRLVVSGPPGIPDAASGQFTVETTTLDGAAKRAEIVWQAQNAKSELVAEGHASSSGRYQLLLPATLQGVRRLNVTAQADGFTRTSRLELAPQVDAPLAHLACDKPAYRPGEVVRLRALLLDRVSLDPRDGTYRFQVTDAKGTSVQKFTSPSDQGVCDFVLPLAEDAPGGWYQFELRDAKDAFTFERLKFLVQRFETPRLSKKVELDRNSYAPGASGSAELIVQRVEGGAAARASVEASLIVDGVSAWSGRGVLDAGGRAIFRFEVPKEVERGEARFVAIVEDGNVVETAFKPFVVPTGKLNVHLYPEGGDLVASVANRVYVEVEDALDRPVDARGRLVDDEGRELSSFETLHQGRGLFTLTPRTDRSYKLVLESPCEVATPLPTAVAHGVALTSLAASTPAAEPIELRLTTRDAGPFLTGVFCRGVLVGQQTVSGVGEHELRLPLDPRVAGVLRVTVFDAALTPIAERLVHREAKEHLKIEVEPRETRLLPSAHQTLKVRTTDESGRPVAALLGMSVSDLAVRSFVEEPRIGLASQASFFADVEPLEELGDFAPANANARRNIDLVLGTQGWRRFAWSKPDDVKSLPEDRGRRLLAREGRAQIPLVEEVVGDGRQLLAAARRSVSDASEIAATWWTIQGAAFVLGILFVGVLRWIRRVELVRRVLIASIAPVVVLVGGWWVLGLCLQNKAADMAICAARIEGVRELATILRAEDKAEVIDRNSVPVTEDELRDVDQNQLRALQLLGYGVEPAGAVDEFFVQRLDEGVPEAAALVPDAAGLRGAFRGPREAIPPGLGKGRVEFAKRSRLGITRIYAHENQRNGPREDFAETVYWNPHLLTDVSGRAEVEFDLSDRVTTWVVAIDAHGAQRIGESESSFEAVAPLSLEAKWPAEVSEGDDLLLPVALNCADPSQSSAQVAVAATGSLTVTGPAEFTVALSEGRGRVLVPVHVGSVANDARLALRATAGAHRDGVERSLRVVARGFPHHESRSGLLRSDAKVTIAMPEDLRRDSLTATLTIYPSPLSDLLGGLDGLLREPCGCFEQTSSANYPNIMALTYMRSARIDEPALASRGRDLLTRGYARLVGYECKSHGYEWFGSEPAHEALTAYGLLEFHDMAGVFDVDPAMVARTREWLLARRDGHGGYLRNARALDSFGAAPAAVTDAYVTYALAVTGEPAVNLKSELDRLAARALESSDPYEVALGACGLAAAARNDAAAAARARLKEMQAADGTLTGTTTSITSSRGQDLVVETTALSIQAWLADPADRPYVAKAAEALMKLRKGGGTFGATQATVQALKALTGYAEARAVALNPGEILVRVNGDLVSSLSIRPGAPGALTSNELVSHLVAGENVVTLEATGGNELPWTLDVRYHSDQPADAADCAVALRTNLARTNLEEGESVALNVELENLTDGGLPMTMAVVGLPAGLDAPIAVLDAMKAAGDFDLWERNGRELIFYWRQMAPRQVRRLVVDLEARIPGESTGAASRAWLYYTPSARRFTAPLSCTIH